MLILIFSSDTVSYLVMQIPFSSSSFLEPVRFEILMSVKITLFWAMTPYRSTLSPSSGLNMESVCSAETLVSTDESTGPHNPERYFKYENLLWMVVKLGLSYERKDIGSGCLKTDC